MIKKLFSIIKWPFSILIGGYVYFWLISNPLETYRIPIIIYWMPDVIGWNGFFIFLGLFAGVATLGICGSISGDYPDE
tara:strand:+ start:210 stop:443 length:234 start_codon:yes stop_codon:yes gene_type:complete